MRSPIAVLPAVLAFIVLLGPAFAEERPPNIVYILADDLGYGDLGCYGQETIPTPRLDQMAAEGMRFTRHYSGSTVCAPSRCVLMTGLHTGNCTVRGNNPVLLKPGDITVAEVLKDRGYATGCFGKWGVGHPPARDEPNRQGFDEFYGYVNMFHAHNFYPEFLIRNGQLETLRNVTEPVWMEDPERRLGGPKEGSGVAEVKRDYAPDLITTEALRFIEEHRDRPFFLYFALNVPHTNNEAGRSPDRHGMEVPDYGEFADRDWPEPEKGFAAMIRNMDRDVGRLLDLLEELGLARDTFVMFSSDNGPHQEGGHEMEFFDSNGDLNGKKRDLTEGGVRVPTIAWWPGTVPAGSETNLLSGFQDFLPTAAEIAGAPVPEGLDGISLLPTLTGGEQEKRHEFLYWEFLERGGKKAVVTERWKAIYRNTLNPRKTTFVLYDLEEDPGETTDVSEQFPEVTARLQRAIEESHTPPDDGP